MADEPKKPGGIKGVRPLPKPSDERDTRKEYHRGLPASRDDMLTPIAGTPVISKPGDELVLPRTASSDELLADVSRRSKETKNASLETMFRVDAVRKELREDVKEVSKRLDNTNEKVDAVIEVVSDLREVVGELGGTTKTLVKDLQEDREERRKQQTVQITTKVELEKLDKASQIKVQEANELARIELEQKEAEATRLENQKKKDHWRLVSLKVLGGVGAIWAVISTIILTKGC